MWPPCCARCPLRQWCTLRCEMLFFLLHCPFSFRMLPGCYPHARQVGALCDDCAMIPGVGLVGQSAATAIRFGSGRHPSCSSLPFRIHCCSSSRPTSTSTSLGGSMRACASTPLCCNSCSATWQPDGEPRLVDVPGSASPHTRTLLCRRGLLVPWLLPYLA